MSREPKCAFWVFFQFKSLTQIMVGRGNTAKFWRSTKGAAHKEEGPGPGLGRVFGVWVRECGGWRGVRSSRTSPDGHFLVWNFRVGLAKLGLAKVGLAKSWFWPKVGFWPKLVSAKIGLVWPKLAAASAPDFEGDNWPKSKTKTKKNKA